MLFLLWILAVVLVTAGILAILRGEVLWGVVLIIVGLLVGPGGVSVFDGAAGAGAMLPAAIATSGTA